MNEFLDRDAGKDGLVHEDGGEGVAIFGEEFLKKGGAASGRGDNKYGLVNLLPVPVLDGGHILLCSIEAIRGKALNQKTQEYIFLAGFIVVIGAMVFATWNDLMRYKVFQMIGSWF